MLSTILVSGDIEKADKNKFELLYYRYRDILFNCAINIVKNKTDAEDVLQNAFIKIARNIKCVNDIKSKETMSFLIVITKNCAYDFIRKNNKIKEVSIEDLEELNISDEAIESIVSELQYKKIVEVIKSIPSPYIEVLFLHYVNDYSIKKTANILKRKQATVKMQIVRGKKILIEKLQEAQYE